MAGSVHVGSEPSKMRNDHFNLPCSSKYEKVQDDGLAMDIKGFDPFVSNSVGRSSPINTFPVGTLRQDMARVTETGVEMKGMHHSVKDLEEDEGYFSPCSKELKVEKKPSQSEPVHEGRSSFSLEESTLDISYETTIPLKVQVGYDHRCCILHARNQH